MANKRFFVLNRRFKAKPELHQQMKKVIDGYLNQDPPLARRLTSEEAKHTTSTTYYLPIHPVTNPNKPGKIRIVNDAAAEFEGVSLNKSLKSGPDLLRSLVGVLIRFRVGKVAIAADIEAMFHQVRVNSEDADSLRFLWKDNPNSESPPDVLQMLVHIFGAKDSPTCANYALRRTARDNAADFDALTYESVINAFYVDDLLKSVDSLEVAIKLAKELMLMLMRGGFKLTKFLSNFKKVLDALPKADVSASAIMDIDIEKIERALGIAWDVINDIFTFTVQLKNNPYTKRGILKTTASVFDPLGFLIPFILMAKLLLQELWRQGCDWDQAIDDASRKAWDKWLAGAKKLSTVKIQRRYFSQDKGVSEIQLHVFCDASERAFGCVAYLRYTFKDGEHACAFVMAKSRLAPIKTVPLPRLETKAARSGARLSHLLVHEVDRPISRIQFWSDSTLTLQYIQCTKHRMKVFISNHVSAILELSTRSQWRHVPGTINPADILTRGVMDPEKLMDSRWFTGAEFLEHDEKDWPALDTGELDPKDPEIRTKPIFVAATLTEEDGINLEKFSHWLRLLRVVGWVLRFRSNCQVEKPERNLGPLALPELEDAESTIIREVQRCSFQDEIRLLQSGKALPSTNPLSSLNPTIDESGNLRVGGRLKNLPIPPEMKHPRILPRKHQVTKILVDWIHRKNGHVGPDHVHSLLREKFWVVGARVVINQVLYHCFFCKVRRAQRQYPFMADLPLCRAAVDEPPFSHCGVDVFGHFNIKQGRKKLKRWVVLFTCLTVRAVHLEVIENCDTDAFINAARRFINRRGCPTHVYSDNGSNFKGATSELKELVSNLDKTKITDFATTFKIDWSFNPPQAPHMGGAWERLVKSSKEVMYGLIQSYTLTDPQLLTVLTEVESIINSRPLTHLSEDINDYEALTPNHILLGRHRNWASIADTSEADISSRKQWRQVQALRAMFWERWVKEYLPSLTKRSCWKNSKPNFNVGELVLIEEDSLKRNLWPLARISKVMPSTDGVVRVVEVRTKNGTYTRPSTKLFKLEDHDFVKEGSVTDPTVS